MGMERWWSDTEGESPKYSEKNLYQYQFFYHRPHIKYLALNQNARGTMLVT